MTHPDLDEFQKQMAEQNVKMYADIIKSNSRSQRFDQAFFYWFIIFGVLEVCLFIWYLVQLRWWALSSFTVAVSQFALAVLNRKTHARHIEHGNDWQQKYDDAIQHLESLDPANQLLPEIIEEEP